MPEVHEDHAREAADPYCLTPDACDELLSGAPWHRLVVIGDSLAEGLGDPTPGYRTLPWPDRVAEALRRQQADLQLTNLGLRGLRTAEIRAEQLPAALELGPDLAAVVCGGNDMLAPDFDPEAVERDLDAIVGTLRGRGTEVVIFALQNIARAFTELAAIEPHTASLNERVRAVSGRHGGLLIDMWEHPICSEKDVYSSDLMHSSMRGHAVLASEMIRRLGAHLSSVRAGAPEAGTGRG